MICGRSDSEPRERAERTKAGFDVDTLAERSETTPPIGLSFRVPADHAFNERATGVATFSSIPCVIGRHLRFFSRITIVPECKPNHDRPVVF
jgi:hypothetical protein